MNLALICTEKLPSPAIRGGAIQVMIDGIIPFLTNVFDVTIFSIQDPDLPDREMNNGIEYIRFPRTRYSDHVAQELKNHRFDLIHVFNRPKNVPKYKQAAPDSAFVLSLHNDMFSENKISSETAQEVFRSVEYIATVSHYIKNVVIERFPEAENQLKVVYSGIDLNQFLPVWSLQGGEIRSKWRKKKRLKGKKVIHFVGRLSKCKGPHLLIQAMPRVLKQHKNAVLMITGGKWFSDNRKNRYVRYLHRLAKPLGRKIIFNNYVTHDQIPALLLSSDVFVCSSQWQEPLARVHYEAMGAGIPIITTNRGGNGEVVKHLSNGYLIEEHNRPFYLAKAINLLLSKPELAVKLARKGRELVEENFQYLDVFERYHAVYTDALTNVKKVGEE